eukprot:scaffold220630_cov18-Tisochrysis_lutea.AAC.2
MVIDRVAQTVLLYRINAPPTPLVFIPGLDELGASVNAAKARIDELNAALGNKRTETPAHATDSEHSSLLQVTMVHSCFWHASQGTWSTTSINIYALSTCIVMCGCQLLYRTCFAEHVYT